MNQRLTSEHLMALHDAVNARIAANRDLHWKIVPLMGKGGELSEQLKITDRLSMQDRLLTEAMAIVGKMFEDQFKA